MLPDIPLFGGSAPPAVRRPVFEIAFAAGASGGGDDSLLGSAVSAAADVLGLGGGEAEDPWKRSVARIVVEMGLAPEVDSAHIVLAEDAQAPPTAIADEGTIALGYEDDAAATVFTGRIDAIRKGIRGSRRIAISNGASALAAFRIRQSYENQSAGDIVEELAGGAGIDTGDVAAGPDLSFLVLDAERSAWEHIARLARVSGHFAHISPEGRLDFRPPDDGEPVAAFTWGVDIIGLERTESEPVFDAVTFSGEGAAGSQGKDAWNWLTKEPSPVTGSAGAGARNRPFADRALRSADAVKAAAQALADAAARAATAGILTVPGTPAAVPGFLISLAGVPGGAFDGDYLVTRVRHTYDKHTGFRSRIHFSGQGGGGGASGLLGGLL